MKFNITNSARLEILNRFLPEVELAMYEEIIRCEFDPDTFDPSSFEPELNNENHAKLAPLCARYNIISAKILEAKG